MRYAGVLLLADLGTGRHFASGNLPRLGADFLPKFDEGSVQINVSLPGGSSLKASNEVSDVIDRKLADDAEDRPTIPTARSSTSPAAPAGPSWTNTPSPSTSANTS